MTERDRELVWRLAAFAVLMEANGGIIRKAPSYVLEKYRLAMEVPDPLALLDVHNAAKYVSYLSAWGLGMPAAEEI